MHSNVFRLTGVQPELAQHGLPLLGSIRRYVVKFLDPEGQPQVMSVSSSYQGHESLLKGGLRAYAQAGCTLLSVQEVRDIGLELTPGVPVRKAA